MYSKYLLNLVTNYTFYDKSLKSETIEPHVFFYLKKRKEKHQFYWILEDGCTNQIEQTMYRKYNIYTKYTDNKWENHFFWNLVAEI